MVARGKMDLIKPDGVQGWWWRFLKLIHSFTVGMGGNVKRINEVADNDYIIDSGWRINVVEWWVLHVMRMFMQWVK